MLYEVITLRYPLQHMPIAVKTAISLPEISPSPSIFGTRLMAAPTAPKAVIGKAIASLDVNPYSGVSTGENISPSLGSRATPSYAVITSYSIHYTKLYDFLTNIAGINPQIAGTIIAISIVVDGVTDPLIGHMADKRGMDKRKIMKSAIIPMAILFVLAFTRFNLSSQSTIIYYVAVAVVFWVAYTCYTIPYYSYNFV